jgi:hypothetical protein
MSIKATVIVVGIFQAIIILIWGYFLLKSVISFYFLDFYSVALWLALCIPCIPLEYCCRILLNEDLLMSKDLLGAPKPRFSLRGIAFSWIKFGCLAGFFVLVLLLWWIVSLFQVPKLKPVIPPSVVQIDQQHYCYSQKDGERPIKYVLDLRQSGMILQGVAAISGVREPASMTGTIGNKGVIQLQMVQQVSEGKDPIGLGFSIPFIGSTKQYATNLVGKYSVTQNEMTINGKALMNGDNSTKKNVFHCSTILPDIWEKM